MKTDRLRTLPSTKLLSKIGSSSPKALTEILFGSIPVFFGVNLDNCSP